MVLSPRSAFANSLTVNQRTGFHVDQIILRQRLARDGVRSVLLDITLDESFFVHGPRRLGDDRGGRWRTRD